MDGVLGRGDSVNVQHPGRIVGLEHEGGELVHPGTVGVVILESQGREWPGESPDGVPELCGEEGSGHVATGAELDFLQRSASRFEEVEE